MSVHTPGPWIAREWSCHAPTTVGVEIDGRFVSIAEAQDAANARLIAAAPDLLEVAQAIESHLRRGAPPHEGTELRAQLQAAIEMATRP